MISRPLLFLLALTSGGPLRAEPMPETSPIPPGRAATLQRFVDLRFGVAIPFGLSTFAANGAVTGAESPALFDPKRLDCAEWAKACRAAGARYAILPAKQAGGFCLWPSATTAYSVAASPFKRDLLREYVDAFRKEGIEPCLSFSIEDRHAPSGVKGAMTPAQLKFTLDQLAELLTRYGDIRVLVLENWSSQTGHRDSPYPVIREQIRRLNPGCLVIDRTRLSSPWQTDIVRFEGTDDGLPPAGNPYASEIVLGESGATSGSAIRTDAATVAGRLPTCVARHCNGLVSVAPGRDGRLGETTEKWLSEIGHKMPDTKPAALPAQPPAQLRPLTPVNVIAEGAYVAHLTDGKAGGRDGDTVWIASLPQGRITFDYGKITTVGTLSVLPQQYPVKDGAKLATMDPRDPDYAQALRALGNIGAGRPSHYRILAGEAYEALGIIAEGEFPDTKDAKVVVFPPVKARFMAFEALYTRAMQPLVIDEIAFGEPD